MKFLVQNYSCFQNPWLGGYLPQIPVLCPQQNWLNPHHRTKFLGTPLHVTTTLCPQKKTPYLLNTGLNLDTLVKRKISCPCQEPNPPTTLPQLPPWFKDYYLQVPSAKHEYIPHPCLLISSIQITSVFITRMDFLYKYFVCL